MVYIISGILIQMVRLGFDLSGQARNKLLNSMSKDSKFLPGVLSSLPYHCH